MLKMIGFNVPCRPRSECDGADPANLNKRYAFILPSTDGYMYGWNGSAWSKSDEPMFTFCSEFPNGSDGFRLGMDEAIERAGIWRIGSDECPPYRHGFMAFEVPAGADFPNEVGAKMDFETGWYVGKDRRLS